MKFDPAGSLPPTMGNKASRAITSPIVPTSELTVLRIPMQAIAKRTARSMLTDYHFLSANGSNRL